MQSNRQREREQKQLQHTTNNIGHQVDGLRRSLRQLDSDIKEDENGVAEFNAFKRRLEIECSHLRARVDDDRAWIEGFERSSDNGAFEAQYRQLLAEIEGVYETAKGSWRKGIDLLIRDFGYHIAFKRWNDSFTAVPFTPK